MRFRTKTRPRGLLRPGDQKRLSLLIVGFGVILLCFSVARRPEFWKRMFPDQRERVETAQQAAAPDSTAVSASTMLHDEFYIGSDSSPNDVVSVTTQRVSYDETPAEAKEPQPQSNTIPRLPTDLLRTIKDDVIGVHSPEADAYFTALKMALRAEEKKYTKPANGAYALFMDSPNGSRGEAWQIEGQLRRLSIVRSRSNSLGVGSVYDAWLHTADSGDQLVHVVAMKADSVVSGFINDETPKATRDFPHKDAPPVRFVGYFFKIEGYPTEEGISRAPLFLAGTLRDIPLPSATANRADELTPYLGYLALIICISVLFMVWSFAMSDVAHAQTRAHQLTKLPAVASFDDVTSMSVVESLNELSFPNSQSDANSNRLN